MVFYLTKKQSVPLHCNNDKSDINLNNTGIIHLSSSCQMVFGTKITGGKMVGKKAIIETKFKMINQNIVKLVNESFNSSFLENNNVLNNSFILQMSVPPSWHEYHHSFNFYKYTIGALVLILILIVLILYCVCSWQLPASIMQ